MKNNSTAIIQARMSSKRFPGKVLKSINGKCLLEYLIDGLSKSKLLSGIVVATSIDSTDDPIAVYCQKTNMKCFRGSLENVANRYIHVIEELKIDHFVRVNADSPLLDFRIVDKAVETFKTGDFEIVTNVLKRSFPKGQTVEVVSSPVFKNGIAKTMEPQDYEHITRYFYQHTDDYKIYNFTSGKNYEEVQLSVDTENDFDQISKIITNLSKPHWEYGWDEMVQEYERIK